jgi:PAS domain S-box-containing protein
VFIIGLVCTVVAVIALERAITLRDQERFGRAADQVRENIEAQLETYGAMLRATSAFFAASERVTREEFREFVGRLELPRLYPGIQGIGFAARAPEGGQGALESIGRAEWEGEIDEFHVWPRTPDGEDAFAILFLEPLDERNRRAIGFDMFSEPVRREAMERARDSGLPAMSARVTLVQETDEQAQPGFLVYLPVYRDAVTPGTVQGRREAIAGFVYSPFRATDLFNRITPPASRGRAGVTVYDGDQPVPDRLLYRSTDQVESGLTSSARITFAGRTWTLEFRTLPGFERASGRGLLLPALLMGLAMSGLLALIAGREARARAGADAAREEARASSMQLRQTLDTAAVGLVRVGRDLRYITANPAYAEIAGVAHDAVAGKTVVEVLGEEGLAIIRPYIDRVLAGERVEYEADMPWVAAGTKRIRVVYTPWREADGSVSGWVASITDVTARAAAEEALRLSEARKSAVLETALDAVIMMDARGRVVDFNPAAERTFGYRREEVLGREMAELIIPAGYRESHRQGLRRHIAGEPGPVLNRRLELSALRRDGTEFPAELTITRTDVGGVTVFTGYVRDITAVRRAQARDRLLLALEDATRAIDDPQQITHTAAGTLGRHLGVNRCAYADVEADENTFDLLGDFTDGVASIVGRYTFDQFGEECLRLMRAGQPFVVEDSEADPRCAQVRGAYRATSIRSVICVPLHKAGRFVAAMAVHQNTPRAWREDEVELVQTVAARCWESIERARVTRGLRDSEFRYRAFIANSSEGIWRLELEPPMDTTLPLDEQVDYVYAHARFAECNDVMARMYGLSSPEELIGRSLEMMLPSGDARSRAYIRHVLESGYRLADVESQELDAQGRTVYFSNSMVGVVENARLLRVWGTQRDITARRAAEEELARYRTRLETMVHERTMQLEAAAKRLRDSERLASMGTLAAGLGHDLHNALLPLRVHVEELQRADHDGEQVRQSAAAIGAVLGYLSELSRGMRMLAMDPGQEGSASVTDAAKWEADAGRIFQSGVGRGIEVCTRSQPGCPPLAIAPHRLTQAVFNLVQNARDAIHNARGERSGGRIDITLAPAAGGVVEVAVRDNGTGMTEEVRRRCMEPFFTTRTRTAGRSGAGTGMGLSIVAGIIQGAGGRVEVESAVGEGTTFRMLIPAVREELRSRPAKQLRAGVQIRDPRQRAFVAALLSAGGWEVDPGENGLGDPLLLVTDAASASPEQLRRFARPPREALVLGVGREDHRFDAAGVSVHREGEPLAEVRELVGRVIARLAGG